MTDESAETAFLTLAGVGEAEIRVRGSRFIAVAAPAADESTARALIDARGRRFHDATHHCAAWRFRGGGWRALDAGEPSGSAGGPILAMIDGAGLVDTVVVVTRYFGGTKLGVGGLARAYGDAAAAALDAAPRRRGLDACRLVIPYTYDDTAAVMRVLERLGPVEIRHDFSPDGEPSVSLTLPRHRVAALDDLLRDATGARVEARSVADTVLYLTRKADS